MKSLVKYYPIHSIDVLKKYLSVYLQMVLFSAEQYEIDLKSDDFCGGHLGLQVLSSEEFDECHNIFLKNSKLIHDEIIHGRRNRVYKLNEVLEVKGIEFLRIEIFEPKPDADISKLRPGIEHVAFVSKNYDELFDSCKQKEVPIDKFYDENGSKFFKTSFINGVEIEFRNDRLGEDN